MALKDENDTLRALLTETVSNRDEVRYIFGTDLLSRIDAALKAKG
jgi:hypothetical protein